MPRSSRVNLRKRWGNQVGHEALINILDTKTTRVEL